MQNIKGTTVSVIIPIYNMQQYLVQCLNSALSQTLNDIEIICVNDGSTDDSLKILEDYKVKYKCVCVYSIKNSGAAAARNYALNKVSGEFVTFLDADDYYPDVDALKNMYLAAKKHSVQVCGGLRLWDINGKIQPHPHHRDYIQKNPNGVLVDYWDYQRDYHYHSYIYSTALIRRYNLSFPDYQRYEDPVFFARVLVRAKKFYIIPEEVYCYRRKENPSPLTPQATVDMLKGITDNLILSSDFQLASLHMNCVKRINKEYFDDILLAIQTQYKSEVYKELFNANKAQNYSLLQKIDPNYQNGTKLIPLQYIDNNNEAPRKSLIEIVVKYYKDNGLKLTIKRFFQKVLKH